MIVKCIIAFIWFGLEAFFSILYSNKQVLFYSIQLTFYQLWLIGIRVRDINNGNQVFVLI